MICGGGNMSNVSMMAFKSVQEMKQATNLSGRRFCTNVRIPYSCRRLWEINYLIKEKNVSVSY